MKSEVESLSQEEREAYEGYKGPALAPSVQATLFELYLRGEPLAGIQKVNKNFTLGMIAKAKVEGLWNARRAAYTAELYDSVVERVKLAQTEAAVFAADLLAVAHKQFGLKLKRYIQTGDEKELGDLSIKSLEGYRKAIDLLLRITGQDQKQTVKGEVKHEHTLTVGQGTPLSPDQAAALLAIVDKDGK